jgi:hypothetical protein
VREQESEKARCGRFRAHLEQPLQCRLRQLLYSSRQRLHSLAQ